MHLRYKTKYCTVIVIAIFPCEAAVLQWLLTHPYYHCGLKGFSGPQILKVKIYEQKNVQQWLRMWKRWLALSFQRLNFKPSIYYCAVCSTPKEY